MGCLVCNFSGAYQAEGLLDALQENGATVLDLSGLEGTNCYCTAVQQIEYMLPAQLPKLRWTDSGDYHYMSHILAKRETQPFHLLLLDNHPDNQEPAFPGILSCGSWVKAMREENPFLRDILWIGPENGEYEKWIERRRGERVYVSVDKDVMSREWARTDWTQGEYTLEKVKRILAMALERMEAAAIDICGEMAESKGATPQDLRINKETNIELYKLITDYVGN